MHINLLENSEIEFDKIFHGSEKNSTAKDQIIRFFNLVKLLKLAHFLIKGEQVKTAGISKHYP